LHPSPPRVERVKCGRNVAVNGEFVGLKCDRWANHPGRCAPDPDAIDLDFEYSMRIRIVEATEKQAAALERIADVLDEVYEGGAGAIRIINLAGDE
jgi:hypothetical protein